MPKGSIAQAFSCVLDSGRTLISRSAVLALIIISLSLTGCDKTAQNTMQFSESPTINEPSQSGEDTAASQTPNTGFSKPGVYEIPMNTTYSLSINNKDTLDICIKSTTNVDGDECTTLVVGGLENNTMDIANDKAKIYVIRKDNGELGVLISGEGNGDIKFNTYVYKIENNKAVFKAGSGYETVSVTVDTVVLRGTRNVLGTWVISNVCELDDDFSIKYSNGGFFSIQNSVHGTTYLDTKMDIPVQILKDKIYAEATLPAGSRIYPTSIGNENGQICLLFKTEDGTAYRLFTGFGEHSYHIDGIDEYEVFVDIPYEDTQD